MRLYMEVTPDELQLPVAVATSVSELARLRGTTVSNIRSCISHAKKYGYNCKFIIIEIEDDNISVEELKEEDICGE